jgi:hypothetical protein
MRAAPVLIASIVISAMGCAGHLVYVSQPYRGKVIDAETRQPLAGAVVLAIWYREAPVAPHGPAVDYHDAIEVLTDVRGEFTVPGRTHVTPIGKIREPEFVIYLPGYGYYPAFQSRPIGREMTDSSRRYIVVALPRWKTRAERRHLLDLPVWTSRVPLEKMPNLVRLANQEGQEIGIVPIYGTEKSK